MKSIITLGQALVVAVTGMGPLVYYALSDNVFAENRKYKVEFEFKKLTEEGQGKLVEGNGKSDQYQGMPNTKVCMGQNKQYESVYDLRFKDGSSIEASGWRAGSQGISIREPFEVLEKKSYVQGNQWVGSKEVTPRTLDEQIKQNMRLIIYKDGLGQFGAILVGSVKDMWWTEYTKDNLADQVEESKFKQLIEHIRTGEFAVRRSVKGVWSELTSGKDGCKQSQVKQASRLYKNYGVLVEKWSTETKSIDKKQFSKGIFQDVFVLDWIDFGFKNIELQEGEWINPSSVTGKSSPSNAIGRWDYWKIKNSESGKTGNFEVIIGKLSDIVINKDGIEDGKGNKIQWSDKFKPTKWEVSLVK